MTTFTKMLRVPPHPSSLLLKISIRRRKTNKIRVLILRKKVSLVKARRIKTRLVGFKKELRAQEGKLRRPIKLRMPNSKKTKTRINLRYRKQILMM